MENIEDLEENKENKILEENTDLIVKEEKKYFRILGFTLWRLFAYFIIYSVLGFVVETLFGIARYRSFRK